MYINIVIIISLIQFSNNMRVIQVEGNIAAGKTTFINFVKKYIENTANQLSKKKIVFIDEPLSQWMEQSLFQKYYTDPEKYAETFQTFAFLTILRKSMLYTVDPSTDIVITERSLFSSLSVFTKHLLNRNLVSKTYYDMLQNSYYLWEDIILQPDIIIYFQIDNNDISILQERIRNRQRETENNISLQYLLDLNNVYDNFIDSSKYQKAIRYNIPIKLSKQKQEKDYFIPYLNEISDMVT